MGPKIWLGPSCRFFGFHSSWKEQRRQLEKQKKKEKDQEQDEEEEEEKRKKEKTRRREREREKIEQRNELVIISRGNKIRESNGKVASFFLIANELPTRELHMSSNLIASQTRCFTISLVNPEGLPKYLQKWFRMKQKNQSTGRLISTDWNLSNKCLYKPFSQRIDAEC